MRIVALLLLMFASCGSETNSGLSQTDGNALPEVTLGDTGGAATDVAPDMSADACTCAGLECGTNSCGEECGSCPQAAPHCYDNVCTVDCRPDCEGMECGHDGCGGTCGSCGASAARYCLEGQCFCSPTCGARECGNDGCDGTCGTCPAAAPHCVDGFCKVESACPTIRDLKFKTTVGDDGVSCEGVQDCTLDIGVAGGELTLEVVYTEHCAPVAGTTVSFELVNPGTPPVGTMSRHADVTDDNGVADTIAYSLQPAPSFEVKAYIESAPDLLPLHFHLEKEVF